jgi:hypothetical protein
MPRSYDSPNEDAFTRSLHRVTGFDGEPSPKPFADRSHTL